MGYTRSFKSNIQVKGSVRASYPASQKGGSHTVTYQQTVPVTVNIHVNSDPLEHSVRGARTSVDQLTTAVVAMNSAQCKAIQENSQKISQHLVDGFYKLIHSDLSAKKAEQYNEIQSRYGLLTVIAKDLQTKYERMNHDLARLQNHYAEIFHGMDSDLQKRIRSLDRSVFRLSDLVRTEILEEPLKREVTLGINQFGELKNSVELITLAHTRKRMSGILQEMAESAENSVSYAERVVSSLDAESCESQKTEYVPVVYCQAGQGTDQELKIYAPEIEKKQAILPMVQGYLVGRPENMWKSLSDEETGAIERGFFAFLEKQVRQTSQKNTDSDADLGINSDSDTNSGTDSENGAGSQNSGNNLEYSERVYQEILKMWQADRSGLKNI